MTRKRRGWKGSGMKKCLLALFLFSGLLPGGPASSADYLTASGCSVSNTGYLTELAKEYEKRTGVKVYVRGGGSVLGIEDLHSGKVDFAASCRSRERGDPADIQFVQVAWDALVFIVHRANPVQNITLNDAQEIYSGRITNWRQLNGKNAPIKTFVSRSKKGLSGVEALTKTMILRGKDPVETPNTFFVASTGIVEQMVEETPEGFATSGFTSARKRDVKMLKISGVYPTNKNIINNTYPLKRALFILIPAKTKPEVRRFVDFVLSKEGQQFIRSLGVVSLMDVK
jgi:phosphate transport system substrate-binding protein